MAANNNNDIVSTCGDVQTSFTATTLNEPGHGHAAKKAGQQPLPQPLPFAGGFQLLSCLRCAHRKLRCDRLSPCSRCTKNEVLCEFPPPKTEKRRRRKILLASSSSASSSASSASDNKLRARLDHYEEILKGLGVDTNVGFTGISNSSTVANNSPGLDVRLRASDTYVHRPEVIGKPVDGHIEGNLWTKMEQELKAGNLLSASSDDEEGCNSAAGLALGQLPGAGTAQIQALYPPQQHFSKLWQIYRDNIQPITMILHTPSTNLVLAEAVKGCGHASKEVEVLLFAVMACALMSITDTECMRKLGERRSMLLSRYSLGCELALINAKFLVSSSLGVLKAYTIYLFAVGPDVDPHELWNLTGIAKRNAQRLGLHQEKSTPGLTPFELEMRRRLWSQIVMYDAISAQAVGLGPEFSYDITFPSNVNDSDLSPTMKEPPKERIGATDMLFCNLRYKILKFMSKVNAENKPWGVSGGRWNFVFDQGYREATEKAIEELEKETELDLLRYCDTLNPVHFFTAIVARLTLCKLRFTVFHAPKHKKEQNDFTATDRNLMFSMALKVLEYENNIHSQPSLQGFFWHTHREFQWSCLLQILEDLKTWPNGEDTEKAWKQICMLYELRPALYQGQKRNVPLYTAINKMTLEAWQVQEIRASEFGQALVVPIYIAKLREQEQRVASEQQALNPQHPSTANPVQTSEYQAHSELLQAGNFEQELANWSAWPDLGMDMHFLDAMPNLNQGPLMPLPDYNNERSQSQIHLPPSAWTEESGDKW